MIFKTLNCVAAKGRQQNEFNIKVNIYGLKLVIVQIIPTNNINTVIIQKIIITVMNRRLQKSIIDMTLLSIK